MIKLTGSNYPIWKSKMREMLVCKDMWLPVLHGASKPENIDTLTWDDMNLKTFAYSHCFINMSLYNNFGDESKANVAHFSLALVARVSARGRKSS